MNDFGSAVERILNTLGAQERLAELGWSISRDNSVLTLETAAIDVRAALAQLEEYAGGFESIKATGVFGDVSLSVIDPLNRKMVVNQSGNYRSSFEREYEALADKAWLGDGDSALMLPGSWKVTISQDLAKPFREVAPALGWQVLTSISVVESEVAAQAPWQLAPLLDATMPTIFICEDLGPSEQLVAGRSAFAGLVAPSISRVVSELPQADTDLRHWHSTELASAPSPFALKHSVTTSGALAGLSEKLWQACGTMSWAAMATAVSLSDEGHLLLEIFGLQRVEYSVEREGLGITVDQCKLSYDIYSWTVNSPSVDPALAVRQVASLYGATPPWARSEDVYSAAQAVFNELRRGAVSEVMQARRAIRQMVIEITQKTVDATAVIARSTAERCVATLLAIGGVIVAQTTEVISDDVAQRLRWLLAIFLVFLLLWNVFIERQALFAPLKSLKEDMPKIADLMSDDERAEILGLAAIRDARRRTYWTSAAVPVVYLIAATAALLVQ